MILPYTNNEWLSDAIDYTQTPELIKDLYTLLIKFPDYTDNANWEKTSSPIDVLNYLVNEINKRIVVDWRILNNGDNFFIRQYADLQPEEMKIYTLDLKFLQTMIAYDIDLFYMMIALIGLLSEEIGFNMWYESGYVNYCHENLMNTDWEDILGDGDGLKEGLTPQILYAQYIEESDKMQQLVYKGYRKTPYRNAKALEKAVNEFVPKHESHAPIIKLLKEGLEIINMNVKISDFDESSDFDEMNEPPVRTCDIFSIVPSENSMLVDELISMTSDQNGNFGSSIFIQTCDANVKDKEFKEIELSKFPDKLVRFCYNFIATTDKYVKAQSYSLFPKTKTKNKK